MKPWVLPPLAVAVAVPSALLLRPAAPARAENVSAAGAELSALSERFAELSRRQETLEESVARIATRAAAPASPGERAIDDADIAAAVERWRARHGGDEAPVTAGPDAGARSAAGAANGVADLPIERILTLVAAAGEGANDVYQELRDAGRMDELVAHIEGLAEADPENADVQMLRAVTYLQKIFEVGNGPEAGLWAAKADRTFDVVLEIDPENWDARFTKAVALSNWPAFLGRGAEAVENLEILIRQQEAREPEPHFARSYLFLGNLHQQAGERAKAIEVWRQGLALFPRDADLLRQLELAGG